MRVSRSRQILNQIAAIRDSHPQMTNIFLNGSCLNLFCILRTIHSDAEAYSNNDHVITKIDDKFYDIAGRVSGKGYQPFTAFFNKRRTSRAFTQMFNSKFDIP